MPELDLYTARIPSAAELSALPNDRLHAIIAECRALEATTATEIAETIDWAKAVREAAQRSLASRA